MISPQRAALIVLTLSIPVTAGPVTAMAAMKVNAAPEDQLDGFELRLPTLAVEEAAPAAQPATKAKAEPKNWVAWEKKVPYSLALDFAAVSDYVWRGINFSEYEGERGEDLNYQLGTRLELATPVGNVGGRVWFQWFSGLKRQDPTASSYLQEVDFVAYWNYTIASIGTTVEAGWIAYEFPHVSGNAHTTYEIYGKVSLDDSVIFGIPILNPFVYYGYDYDIGDSGSWVEAGVTRDFAAGDLDALAETPVIKDLTLTPSVVFGIDLRYLHNFVASDTATASNRLALIRYGLDLAYDLNGALGIHKKYGDFSIGGFLAYSQATRRDMIDDELYGGATVAWSW